MTTPLPPQEGTPLAVLNEGFRLLQRRLEEHGGQLLTTDKSIEDKNTAILAAYLHSNDLDVSKVVLTAAQVRDALWEAVCKCFQQLTFERRPERLYQMLLKAKEEKLLARDEARRLKEAAENQPFFDLAASGREFAKQKTKEELAQIDAKCKEERERIIADFSVNASMPGRIDQTKTEDGRAFLRKIKITGRDGKFSEPLTLQAVQACNFCDTVEQMQRALDKWIDNINNAAKNERERQHQRERSGWVGARGGV